MRVLVISFLYPSRKNEVLGIFVHQQAKALREAGIELKVISPVPFTPFPFSKIAKKWGEYANTPREDVIDGIEVRYPRFVSFPKGLFYERQGYLMFRGLKASLEKAISTEKYDIIHVHRAFPDGYATMLGIKNHRIPMVVTLHGMNMTSTIYRSSSCKKSIAKVFDKASVVVTNSNKQRSIAVKELGYQRKIVVIPNGVNEQEIGKQSIGESASNVGRVVLSVSHLLPQKGIGENLIALSKLLPKYPDLLYVIIGEGSAGEHFKRFAKQLGVERDVLFLGRRSHKEVLQYMANCEIFSMPSWNEAFGVVYLEAMACGKPVIGGKGEGIEDVIEHKKDGLLVAPRNVDSLVSALDYLLEDQERAQKIGDAARKKALSSYTWNMNAERYIEVYRSVLAGQRL